MLASVGKVGSINLESAHLTDHIENLEGFACHLGPDTISTENCNFVVLRHFLTPLNPVSDVLILNLNQDSDALASTDACARHAKSTATTA